MVTKLKQNRELTLSPWDDFTTPLHRAGLAGLWMTLKSLASRNGEIISWELISPDTINLAWNCTDKDAITWLLSKAYQLDKERGLIELPALGDLTTADKIALHQGITSTFIQHPRVVDSKGVQREALPIDEKILEVEYKALNAYPHQDLELLKGLYDKKGYFKPSIRIAGWLYPGATELHVALGGKTKIEETPAGVIALVFAPIACSYYRVRSRLKQSKYLWALIVPDVENLETFAQNRQRLGCQVVGYDHYYATGLSDASLRYLTALAGDKTGNAQAVPECEVWVLGKEAWSKQSLITAKQRVGVSPEIRRQYALCENNLPNGVKVGKNGTFISVSFGREIAAENLISGKPWYADLHRIISLSTEYVDVLTYERLGLLNMKEATIEQGMIEQNATLFSDVFTWILRNRYGQVSSNTAGGKANFDRVRTDLQMSIRSVKTQQQFTRWWTNLTSNTACRLNPFLIGVDLGAFNHWVRDNWEECLSLAALAIIAYKDPWKVERTKKILEKLAAEGKISKPKHLIEPPSDSDSEGDLDEESDESSELETNEEEALI